MFAQWRHKGVCLPFIVVSCDFRTLVATGSSWQFNAVVLSRADGASCVGLLCCEAMQHAHMHCYAMDVLVIQPHVLSHVNVFMDHYC